MPKVALRLQPSTASQATPASLHYRCTGPAGPATAAAPSPDPRFEPRRRSQMLEEEGLTFPICFASSDRDEV